MNDSVVMGLYKSLYLFNYIIFVILIKSDIYKFKNIFIKNIRKIEKKFIY